MAISIEFRAENANGRKPANTINTFLSKALHTNMYIYKDKENI